VSQHVAPLGAGVAFLSFDVYDMPPVHALPLGRTSEDLEDEGADPSKGKVQLTPEATVGRSVIKAAWMVVPVTKCFWRPTCSSSAL
jgi:hypothetical protein